VDILDRPGSPGGGALGLIPLTGALIPVTGAGLMDMLCGSASSFVLENGDQV